MTITESVEKLAEPTVPPRWYLIALLVLGLFAVSGLGVGLLGLYINDRNASKQADDAAKQTACLQAFAEQFATGSTEVRAAQVKVDKRQGRAEAAAARRDAALQAVLDSVNRPEAVLAFEELKGLNKLLVERREATVRARRHLQQTRAEHPIPEAPKSKAACDLLAG